MRPGVGADHTLTTSAHAWANLVVRAGRWLLPVACMFVFSTVLAFAARQAFVTKQATITSTEAEDPSNTSSGRVTSSAYWGDPRHCPQTVDQPEIDFYL